ncbi:MAG: gliding motility-associated C-terminal domain-containing protein, partial [Bacteroidia bacterium]
ITHCYTNDSVSAPIMYTTTLIVVSDSGCSRTLIDTSSITVYPKPEASFIITPETLSIIDPVIMITDLSVGATIWDWNFGDANDTLNTTDSILYHEYADTGTYTVSLITTTAYGCKDTAYNQTTIEPEFTFYIPNAFTPNGDGVNDIFAGKGMFIIQYEMLIFDRWGDLVFETNDYNKQWDGKANKGTKMAQRDVYVYKIKVTDIHQIDHFYSGTVTLVQ